jgi:uncharacterized protein (DUF1697 family)
VPRYVVFLRAVNVGGRTLKMAEARKVLEDNGFDAVESHIQTGNFLVRSSMRSDAKVAAEIGRLLGAHAGYDIVAIARTPAELTALVHSADGIPSAFPGDPARYVTFCATEPTADARRELEEWDAGGERAHVIGKDVLVEISVPFNEAKLGGAKTEKIVGVPGTARNLTVVRALAQKWGA